MKYMTIKDMVKGSVKWFLPFCLVAFLPLLASCGEDDDSASGEFDNWQERNETYWNNLYQTARSNADGKWKILRTWSKDATAELKNTDYVIVHVEEQGSGTVSPLYTDSVRMHYVGHLMPSASYPQGYQFDKSYTGSSDQPSSARTNCCPDSLSVSIRRSRTRRTKTRSRRRRK